MASHAPKALRSAHSAFWGHPRTGETLLGHGPNVIYQVGGVHGRAPARSASLELACISLNGNGCITFARFALVGQGLNLNYLVRGVSRTATGKHVQGVGVQEVS